MSRSIYAWLLSFAACCLAGQAAHAQTARGNTFERWDANRDGKLSRDELPAPFRSNFDRVDRNNDGWISREEDLAFRRRGAESKGSVKLPDGIEVRKNIEYVEDGHPRNKLDLYLSPKTEKPVPLVIWIHGGGWRKGDKKNCPARFLLEHGFAVASVNYRLSGHAVFPAQIEDCKAAIRWLRTNAKDLNIDPGRFGVWGSSAGGHLVALLGTSGDVEDFDPSNTTVSSSVQAVCDYFGPTNLLKMNEQAGESGRLDHDSPDSPESKLLGGPLQTMTTQAKRANPITYVSADDPPFLIVHGDKDPLVPLQQSRELNMALTEAGVDTELVVVQGGGHGGFKGAEHNDRVLAFFKAKLTAMRSSKRSDPNPSE